jgi:hypothetical protein
MLIQLNTPRVYETDAGYAILSAYVLLDMPILKAHTSYRLPLFPADGRKKCGSELHCSQCHSKRRSELCEGEEEALVFNTTLVFIVLQD